MFVAVRFLDSSKSISLSNRFVNTFLKLFLKIFLKYFFQALKVSLSLLRFSLLICVPYSTILFRLCQHFLTNFFVYFALFLSFTYALPGVFVFPLPFGTISCGPLPFSFLFSICGICYINVYFLGWFQRAHAGAYLRVFDLHLL